MQNEANKLLRINKGVDSLTSSWRGDNLCGNQKAQNEANKSIRIKKRSFSKC